MPYVVKLVPLLINGMKITIFVSILAFAISIVMGVILAIIQHYHVAILDPIAKVYISYFRGTPLLIQLFLFFYGLPMVMDIMVRCPKILALIICLAMNSAAYMAETIRGAIESVDKGQYEVADEIVFMENGNIVEQATPDIFFTNPQTERAKSFIQAKVDDIYDTDFDKIVERRYMNSYKWKDLKAPDIDKDIYPMWVADMEFKSSPAIQRQMQERVEAGIFGYETLTPEYFKVISEWLKNRHSYKVDASEILFCADTMIGISTYIQAASEVGDEVMLLTPVYGNFFSTITGCGRKVLECPLIEKEGRFTISLELMEEKVSEKTKILLLCNPQNPTGTVWTKDELKDISLFCKKHGMTLISDEVHYEFIFNQAQHTVAASIAEEVGVMAATVISPGKSFNVPMLSGASLIIKDQKMRDKISAIMENLKYPFAHAFVEGVTIAAYTKSVEWLEAVKYYIQENKRIFKEYFETHFPQLKVVNSDSTYVMWVDCSGLNMSDAELEKFWRDDCKLILSHGSEFGTGYSQYRRFNVACSKLKLEEILERILKQMQKNKLI